MNQYELHCGNSKELLKQLESNSIDSIVTDPPYELGFMGKKWDNSGIAYDVELWAECLRVLKPGGHLLAFSGSRTYHRMTVAIEDAGFEIRDQIMWLYGSGFPKSHDVSKAIDKMAGAEREVVGSKLGLPGYSLTDGKGSMFFIGIGANGTGEGECRITAPATDAAKEWNGWGTALKPAHEPICVARKPLIGTVAENVLMHGTGAINVDGCRVKHNEELREKKPQKKREFSIWTTGRYENTTELKANGRWPANIIHDGSAEVLAGFPESNSQAGKIKITKKNGGWDRNDKGMFDAGRTSEFEGYGDKGSAARFFYCAKASKKDRDEGLEGFEERENEKIGQLPDGFVSSYGNIRNKPQPVRNHHPTVKPTNLMQYLCRLVTPPNGLILDPFLGSGSTGKAAMYEGFRFIGFDLNQEYIDISKARIEFALQNKKQDESKKENTLF